MQNEKFKLLIFLQNRTEVASKLSLPGDWILGFLSVPLAPKYGLNRICLSTKPQAKDSPLSGTTLGI